MTFWARTATILCIALFTACTGRPQIHSYRVALRYVPDHLNPRENEVNTNNLILIHLYYPLFFRAANGDLSSDFLALPMTKALDSTFKSFQLCLKRDLKFSDGSPVRSEDLLTSLTEIHRTQEMLPKTKDIWIEGSCVHVSLATADWRYFDKLTSVSSTIIKSGGPAKSLPLGLGPYRVSKASKNYLALEATPGQITGSFKKIEFLPFVSLDQARHDGIQDLNHVYQFRLPSEYKAARQKISRPFFKSYTLTVNYQNAALRKAFASCIDRNDLKATLDMDLADIPGFLPVGLSGARVPFTTNKAVVCRLNPSARPIRFYNANPDNENKLRAFFDRHRSELPIPVEFIELEPQKMVEAAFSQSQYAAIFGFDSTGSVASTAAESSAFFESFFRTTRNQRLIDSPLPGLSAIIDQALQESDPTAKDEAYSRAHRLLLESGYIIPLGQLDTAQYYQKDITQIQWADRISGFPRFDLMQVPR
jgi:ABC-type oligopeptide transport system substrate-binding subunit